MDRSIWLKEIRHETEEKYDTLWAPEYGEKWGLYPNATHQQFIQKFLGLLPQQSTVLDAACGAGRYMPTLLGQGHTVIGMDQSQGMLSRVRERFPNVQVEKMGLQEISRREEFDGAICMDAMEHVSPEDWELILGNFYRALKPQGYLYFTVEVEDESEIEAAFKRGQEAGIPIVYGEMPDEENSVYHYYPSLSQVRDWLNEAGFRLIEETFGDLYQHFLVQKK